MQLSRKGATNSIPIWLLGLTVGLTIFRVALLSGHINQVALKFIEWHPYTELRSSSQTQSKPVLLYYVGDTTAKTKTMDDTVFSNRLVASTVLKYFYPVIVPGTSKLTGEEKTFVARLYKKYMVVQIPSIVITTPAGSIVSNMNGFKPSAATYQFLKSVAESDKLKAIEESDRAPKPAAKKPGPANEIEAEDARAAEIMRNLPSRNLLHF